MGDQPSWFVPNMRYSYSPVVEQAYEPFAWEELTAKQAFAKLGDSSIEDNQGGAEAPPWLHFWRHANSMVLGLRDARLPNVTNALQLLSESGRESIVRNSGGAAVPLDLGVLNVTMMILARKNAISTDFQMMVELIKWLIGDMWGNIKVGQINGSYCPGKYDLSIGGRKFAGLAQRRVQMATMLQAFIVMDDRNEFRTKLVQDFYKQASPNGADAPSISLNSMISLQEALSDKLTAEARWLNWQGKLHKVGVHQLPLSAGASQHDVSHLTDLWRKRYMG